jgi:hypothetical protein
MTAACGDQFPIYCVAATKRIINGSTKMEEAGESSFESSQSQERKSFDRSHRHLDDSGVLLQSESRGR